MNEFPQAIKLNLKLSASLESIQGSRKFDAQTERAGSWAVERVLLAYRGSRYALEASNSFLFILGFRSDCVLFVAPWTSKICSLGPILKVAGKYCPHSLRRVALHNFHAHPSQLLAICLLEKESLEQYLCSTLAVAVTFIIFISPSLILGIIP